MFSKSIPLFKEAGLNKLASSTVLVFGCGGVGSFAIEALARSGIGTLIIVDKDRVEISNINRQIAALHSTLDQLKVDILEARIKDINPNCTVIKYPMFYTLENKHVIWDNHQADFVLDAIDTVTFKLDIIRESKARNIRFITVVGQGNRMAPEKVTIKELKDTSYDPLAKVIRVKLQKERLLKNTPCVCSEEIPRKFPHQRRPASNAFVPATAGLTAAAYIVRELIKE
ncbi:tRNA threonylcarbamoyladenosine dehydratase [Liberiplasma polymorphum]|uniref:tRNA threonylcarbamoyladenosine dehydratase n=1 Tax=Liberiplasma polymorphum TaxID=3374570 RepID=UPI0037765B9A